MSRLYNTCLEEAEQEIENICLLFKAKKISREQAKKQILEDKNIRFCILSNMDYFDYDDAANEILDDMKSTIMLVHNKKGERKWVKSLHKNFI